MNFLIKAQESTVSYRFSYIRLNVGSETLFGYIISPNSVHFAVYFLFCCLCFNAMISKNELHLITPGSDIFLSLYLIAQIFLQLIRHGTNPYTFEMKACPKAPRAVLIRNQ